MSASHSPAPATPTAPAGPSPDATGLDLDAVRARYRQERDRRLRPDGNAQYARLTGAFGYWDEDPYAEGDGDRPPLADDIEAVVVGGGFGGLLTAARLRQRGVASVRVIEKGSDFGGTWYWNRYPGIHCDIESYVYLPLLEETGTMPGWKYAPGEEIRHHARAVGHTFGLYEQALFRTRVTELRWDEGRSRWLVTTDRGDQITARYVVTATGTLSEPKLPALPGIETFRGHTFHTSRWDYAYTGGDADGNLSGLADKRVGVIGTGATALQCVPHLGASARHLYVFQRTPSTVDVRANRPTDPGWAASLAPGWHRRRRENFLTLVTGGSAEEDLVADGWTSTARLQQKLIATDAYRHEPEAERERAYELADHRKMHELRTRVAGTVKDPETAELLKPWYRYMCKRPGFSDTYLETFNRPNVTLVDTADTHGVERFTGTGVVVGDTTYEVDCLVFATGFAVGVSGVTAGLLPAYGRDGVSLREAWAQGPRTLHGLTTHGFPNLFQMGSLQNAASVNFTHTLDEQATHIAEIVAAARERGARWVEPTREAQDTWVETIRATAADQHAFQAECTPGYYNNEGMPRRAATSYGAGPVAFHELLAGWRAGGGLDEVLVGAR
ncbi:flavin-containing monooxygenase [Streptomyces zingiberis]|uniref:NAD(P)/FAD-dependent oxidoreductase n=1 Tax=Streptomyces zingiberis TaxID=2053010 RepID=A0ABX1C4M5_9ACTN|nr:NAD(P)/FAD-dependent oxidoreductase [Streptomyces zingiberis]NJQ03115.1 NAD(P)/FAD-dependent oxidoreductase [Streptomyces zingiberis]